MFQMDWIGENREMFDHCLKRRGLPPMAHRLVDLDRQRRQKITAAQELQNRRNLASRQIGAARAAGKAGEAAQLIEEIAALKQAVHAAELEAKAARDALHEAMSPLPNLLADDVPDGADEAANVEQRRHGRPREFGFAPKPHFELGEALGLMDFQSAGAMSGARFVVLKGALARLERALGQFMIDFHVTRNGYEEISPPLVMRAAALFGTGQLPKFSADLFSVDEGRYLIPTAEVPLTNLAAGRIFNAGDLPARLVALTPCFRSEAGAAGRDVRGMLRMHQFYKCELVSLTTPEDATSEHERMTRAAEAILQALGLPFRTMLLCSGDTGPQSCKTYDIEVWLPGQKGYREISSCSVCGDYQARRMMGRFRRREKEPPQFLHTLNGSGVAVGRALIAVMENFQNADGSITVPEPLRPLMGGLARIDARAAA